MVQEQAQHAAWDTYSAVTAGLLPALGDEDSDGGDVNPLLGGVAIRIRRYAPLWGEHGPILVAAADSAIRLFRHGDRPALIGLLHVIAHRLFLLSTGRQPPNHPGRRNQRSPWNRRFEP